MKQRATHIPIGEGFQLRSLVPADADAIARYANNRGVWLNLRDRFPHPYALEDAESFIAMVQDGLHESSLAIADKREAIGVIGFTELLDVHWRSVEVGYWLGEPFWGRGIATRALQAFSDYIFLHYDFMRLQSCVFGWNGSSARVLEKSGFTREGILRNAVCKDGRITDMLIFGKLKPM
jgi:[ribosomal protein S5]-alanine N-acetyltransferase